MKTSIVYIPLPMPPKIDLAHVHVEEQHEVGHRGHGIVLAVVGAFGGVRHIVSPCGGVVDTDADFLALHVGVGRIDRPAPRRFGLGWASKYQVTRSVPMSMMNMISQMFHAVQRVFDHPAVVIDGGRR